MPADDRITIQSSTHGQYQCTALSLDVQMAKYPAHKYTVPNLRTLIQERTGDTSGYMDLNTRTECLMILAELDGYATN